MKFGMLSFLQKWYVELKFMNVCVSWFVDVRFVKLIGHFVVKP